MNRNGRFRKGKAMVVLIRWTAEELSSMTTAEIIGTLAYLTVRIREFSGKDGAPAPRAEIAPPGAN